MKKRKASGGNGIPNGTWIYGKKEGLEVLKKELNGI